MTIAAITSTNTTDTALSNNINTNTATTSTTGVVISPQPDQEGNKLQRQKIFVFMYPIYNRNWRNISNIFICNKTSIKRNILTIKHNTSGNRSC